MPVQDLRVNKSHVFLLDEGLSRTVEDDDAPIQEPACRMIRERLDRWCEKGILFLVLSILVFGPLATGAVRPFEFLILQGMTMSAVLLWLIRFWLNPNHRLLWPPICWAVLAFVIYAIVRYQQADLEYVARQELIRILVYALLFFIILNNLARQDFTQTISFVLIFLGMVISIYAIYQFATDSQYVWHFIKPAGYRKRGSGTYICPNHLAGFLEMLAPLGMTYTLSGRIAYLARVFLAYGTVVILAGIGVTVSRGGWIATIAALAVLFAILLRRHQYRIRALVLIMLLVTASVTFYARAEWSQKRFKNLFSLDSQDNIRIRIWIWKVALPMWLDHFWVGVGPGLFDYRFPAYRPVELQLDPGHVHNDYLNTLTDWGLIGTAFVGGAFVLLYTGAFKTWRFLVRESNTLGARPSNRTAFVLGASTGLLAILIHSFTDFNMYIPANAILAITLTALLSGHIRFGTERHWIGPRLIGRILATGIGLIGVVYLGQQGCKRMGEYTWRERAAKEQFYTTTKIHALKQAFAAEPMNFETAYEVGEALRHLSWQDSDEYGKQGREAIEWFERAARLNPFDPYNPMRTGMCFDWLGRHEKAAPFFEKALELGPNDYYTLAHLGWHFLQTGDYARAKEWFERSLKLEMAWHKPISSHYLPIVERKLKEANPSKE